MIKVRSYAPQPFSAYHMVAGERRETRQPDGTEEQRTANVYSVPLHDPSWPDDTLIEFDYLAQP